jgi:hypothetical protein
MLINSNHRTCKNHDAIHTSLDYISTQARRMELFSTNNMILIKAIFLRND